MSTPRAARVGRERVAGGSRRGSVAGAAPARRPPHSYPQLRGATYHGAWTCNDLRGVIVMATPRGD